MHIIITGASKGLGFATAIELARTGEHSVLAISRNKEGLLKLQEQACANNPSCSLDILPMDLKTVLSQPQQVFEMIRGYCPDLDVLIHNAGILINRSFEETSHQEGLEMFETNFFVPAQLTRILLPLMKQAHVLSISSMGGYQGSVKFPGLGYYSASKGALGVWTECMAAEFENRSIRFNSLAIGSVQTEMLEQAFPGYHAPLSPDEMAEFVAGFALRGHRFFNGKILPVSVSTP